MRDATIIISCEHASNAIPAKYQLSIPTRRLNSHHGWDIGAINIAKAIAKHFGTTPHVANYSRLLIDLNRSPHHPHLFPAESKMLDKNTKQSIIDHYYLPYRNNIVKSINAALHNSKSVIHISAHTFTPVMNQIKRQCDVGLLYDPSRKAEKHFCHQWKQLLSFKNKHVRSNYPYKGISDGLTTYLRKIYPVKKYAGIELEINQNHFTTDGKVKTSIINDITSTIAELIQV